MAYKAIDLEVLGLLAVKDAAKGRNRGDFALAKNCEVKPRREAFGKIDGVRTACEKQDFRGQGADLACEGLKPAGVPDVHGKPDCKWGSGYGQARLGDGIVGDVVLKKLSFWETLCVIDCCFDTKSAHRETHDGFLDGATMDFNVIH